MEPRLNIKEWTWDGNKIAKPHVILWRALWTPFLYGFTILLCVVYAIAYFDIEDARRLYRRIT